MINDNRPAEAGKGKGVNGNKIHGAAFVAALLALMLALVLSPVSLIASNVTAYSELEDRC